MVVAEEEECPVLGEYAVRVSLGVSSSDRFLGISRVRKDGDGVERVGGKRDLRQSCRRTEHRR